MSKQRLFLIAFFKADVAVILKVFVRHHTASTSARLYPMEANHNIEHIYNQHLASSLFRRYSHAEMGIEGVRALEQLMCTANVICKNKREMIFLFTDEIQRRKG